MANDSFCQVEGRAWKMPVQAFVALLDQSGHFRLAMNRYLQAYVNMLGQTAACNGLHSVLERCTRWILMTQDRVNRAGLPITLESLATMLESRKSGVPVGTATCKVLSSFSMVTVKLRSSTVPASRRRRKEVTGSRKNSSTV